jgi:hypothetical protein
MAGIKALRKILMGGEAIAGDAIPATFLWRGLGTMEDQRTLSFADEDIGLLQDPNRVYTPKLAAGITFDSVPATFEQLPYIFEASIKSVGDGVADGGGSGKVYAYPVANVSPANTIKTFTIEAGDNQQASRMEYSFVKAFALEGKPGEAWMVNADWIGRQVALCTYTPVLQIESVEEILFSKTVMSINNAGSIGVTPVTQTLLGATLSVPDTGNKAVYTADGNLYFSYQKQERPSDPMTLAVTFEHNTSAVAEIAAYVARTPRAIRLLCQGSALVTPAGYTYKTFKIDMWGVWSKFDKIGEQDGNDIVVGTLRLGYNITDAKTLEITVVNEKTDLMSWYFY